jgi:hypothetical protein
LAAPDVNAPNALRKSERGYSPPRKAASTYADRVRPTCASRADRVFLGSVPDTRVTETFIGTEAGAGVADVVGEEVGDGFASGFGSSVHPAVEDINASASSRAAGLVTDVRIGGFTRLASSFVAGGGGR